MNKICRRCLNPKDTVEFPSKKNGKIPSWCKLCCKAYRQGEGKEKARLRSRKYALKRLYGITPEQFEAAIAMQFGRCAICGASLLFPQQDHNHATGKNRGVLCHGCNTGLGLFQYNPTLLRLAALYLEKHQ